MTWWLTSAPMQAPASVSSMHFSVVEPVDGHEMFGQRRLAVAGTDDEVAAAGHGPGAGGERGEGLVERVGDGEAHDALPSVSASHTRSAVIGSWRTGVPTSFASAFEIAAGVATFGASARPLAPRGPASGVLISHEVDVDRRRIGARLQLVLEQGGVALVRLVVVRGSLGECLADAHQHAALAPGPAHRSG